MRKKNKKGLVNNGYVSFFLLFSFFFLSFFVFFVSFFLEIKNRLNKDFSCAIKIMH